MHLGGTSHDGHLQPERLVHRHAEHPHSDVHFHHAECGEYPGQSDAGFRLRYENRGCGTGNSHRTMGRIPDGAIPMAPLLRAAETLLSSCHLFKRCRHSGRKKRAPANCHATCRTHEVFSSQPRYFPPHAVSRGRQPLFYISRRPTRGGHPVGQHIADAALPVVLIRHGWLCLCRRGHRRQILRSAQ